MASLLHRIKTIRAAVDGRDALALVGTVFLLAGGERIYPGLGMLAAGAVLVVVAVWVR